MARPLTPGNRITDSGLYTKRRAVIRDAERPTQSVGAIKSSNIGQDRIASKLAPAKAYTALTSIISTSKLSCLPARGWLKSMVT
jgi:hypothetical protein